MFLLQIWDKKHPTIWLSWPCTLAKRQSGAEHWSLQYFEDVAGCSTCVWVLRRCLGYCSQSFTSKSSKHSNGACMLQCHCGSCALKPLKELAAPSCIFNVAYCTSCKDGSLKRLLVWMQILNEKTAAAPYKYTWPSGLCNALMPHSGFWKVKVFQRKKGLVGTKNVKTVETASDKLP